MIRYLPGIVLIQLVTLALLWVNRESSVTDLLTSVALPALLLSVVIALWFSAISRMAAQKSHASLVEKHFEEREKMARELERTRADVMQKASADQAKIIERASHQREQLVRDTHQDMIKAERRASRSANLKVGAAFGLVTMAGVGFLFVQFMTLGLLTITAASGALGGYLIRWKQTRHVMQLASDESALKLPKVIDPDKPASGPAPLVIDASQSSDDKARTG